ncbi:MAG: hypothetical protein P1P89_16100 [Desulfobacterales bacterium]|nr:hypothetical protein [Desulfobacterales bacterium]
MFNEPAGLRHWAFEQQGIDASSSSIHCDGYGLNVLKRSIPDKTERPV